MASLSSKGMPAPKSALKQKQLGSALVTEPSNAGWDLGTHVHQADAAGTDSSEVELREAEDGQDEEQTGRSLQGAISLAPKRASLTDTREVPGSLQEVNLLARTIHSSHIRLALSAARWLHAVPVVGLPLTGTCCTLDKQSCAMCHQLAVLMGLPLVRSILDVPLFSI